MTHLSESFLRQMILKYMIDEHELSRVAPKTIKVVIYNDYFTRTL